MMIFYCKYFSLLRVTTFLSTSNHCVVKIVASSEILTNFQQQVVQDQGKETKQKPDRKLYPT